LLSSCFSGSDALTFGAKVLPHPPWLLDMLIGSYHLEEPIDSNCL
jgi:hypothetical protein